MSMISEEEARAHILGAVQPGNSTLRPLLHALGAYAAETVLATVPLPGFDNSMMDGYAVRATETGAGSRLKVTGEQPAGADLALNCGCGEAIRIFTGAPMPAGADAVIMQEDVIRQEDSICPQEPVVVGENVRRAGADLGRGQVVLRAGQRLTPGRLGVLASQGLDAVRVHEHPQVAVLSTGDELVPPGQGRELMPGQIYNSNGVMLQALVQESGVRAVQAFHCADERAATRETLRRLLAERQVLVISGGVSVGDHDHIKPALLDLGLKPDLWRVRVKPGKPFLFAHAEGKYVFGLPGNPVSSYVTFQLFVRPALLRLCGAAAVEPVRQKAECAAALFNDGDRPHYLRGRLEAGIFSPQGLQQSHALFALSQSNALLRLAPGERVAAGQTVEILT